MSTTIENADEGGAKRPSGVSKDCPGGIGNVAESPTGGMVGNLLAGEKPEAFSSSLRRQQTREDALRELLLTVRPEEANPDVWQSWLKGGDEPFEGAQLKRLSFVDRSTARTMDRSSGRVKAAAEAANMAAQIVAAAEQRLAAANADLANAKSYDAAVIHSAVSEHLASIMAPMFAMGPAWTVMRALSAYASPSMLESETLLFTNDVKRETAQEKMKIDRSIETGEVLACLDLWCGDDNFEGALRNAIVDVTKRFGARASERDRDGMRARGKEAMAASIRPSATTAHVDILSGMLAGATDF